ncbi:hypothetical protein AVEN_56979-1 [Araneus ventricosus]|uniref:Uncharacterized protein n=1 Tax=Araneus ventricosus TaxID=182803 RepID=A0A4Y2R1N5_ARAVE|nr:hypothetical protein AVEN_56979-1 [Araneus ventricosus]
MKCLWNILKKNQRHFFCNDSNKNHDIQSSLADEGHDIIIKFKHREFSLAYINVSFKRQTRRTIIEKDLVILNPCQMTAKDVNGYQLMLFDVRTPA